MLAIDFGRQQQIVHVPVLLTVRRHDRPPNQSLVLQIFKHSMIAVPDSQPSTGNLLRVFQLSP